MKKDKRKMKFGNLQLEMGIKSMDPTRTTIFTTTEIVVVGIDVMIEMGVVKVVMIEGMIVEMTGVMIGGIIGIGIMEMQETTVRVGTAEKTGIIVMAGIVAIGATTEIEVKEEAEKR